MCRLEGRGSRWASRVFNVFCVVGWQREAIAGRLGCNSQVLNPKNDGPHLPLSEPGVWKRLIHSTIGRLHRRNMRMQELPGGTRTMPTMMPLKKLPFRRPQPDSCIDFVYEAHTSLIRFLYCCSRAKTFCSLINNYLFPINRGLIITHDAQYTLGIPVDMMDLSDATVLYGLLNTRIPDRHKAEYRHAL